VRALTPRTPVTSTVTPIVDEHEIQQQSVSSSAQVLAKLWRNE